MVETTLEIRFLADDEACASIQSNVAGDEEQQAELVAFAHYAARIVSQLGPHRAAPLVQALPGFGGEGGAEATGAATRVRVVPWEPRAGADRSFRALLRFLDTAGGPRMYFRFRERGLGPVAEGDGSHAAASVHVLFESLAAKPERDQAFNGRLATTAALIGSLGEAGAVGSDNEFDVSLAAADVAWRLDSEAPAGVQAHDIECPACGNTGAQAGFEPRLWPSPTAWIEKCLRCGAGVWGRGSKRPRVLKDDVWSAMEELRVELAGAAPTPAGAATVDVGAMDGGGPLLTALKRVYGENEWPYSEVQGVPVLLSELSGALGRWSFYAHVIEEKELILLYSICPMRAPEGRRHELSQFLTRTNYGLAVGNFELDFDDGEIRYKTVLQLHGTEVDATALRRLVRANGIAMETYLPRIGSVIAGTPAALEAANTSENH
jgi:hypothetical protein